MHTLFVQSKTHLSDVDDIGSILVRVRPLAGPHLNTREMRKSRDVAIRRTTAPTLLQMMCACCVSWATAKIIVCLLWQPVALATVKHRPCATHPACFSDCSGEKGASMRRAGV
jgi:hypothetical protein